MRTPVPPPSGTGAPVPTTAAGSSGQELLDRIAAGEPIAWREVVDRYERLVRSRVRGFRLQPADADDAVSATWLRLAQNAHRIQDADRLPGWLSTVAGRECLRILDRSAHAGVPVEDAGATVPETTPGPEQRALDADIARELRALIADLPRRRRLLIAALFGEDTWSYERISRVTGIPTGSIGPTRARALDQLRRLAVERGLGAAARPVVRGLAPAGTATG
ncbi:sigma-70 family RNA polymerase sigma factor [Pseudonocardia sp. RS11V-5]|uniref:RNA polymerase sigma factor n=1 Tax=Pseudonocardia terrae TaxID=2905831 RepID=UPI001E42ACBF|nr:sigma-70 family RNA polymerase sigma factor [Pseudonocardia terrae]MCE3553401.1 sigma-70 family RNA polymerase sigma factor [Pseudonocardia terrae]